jgi:uncharacterized circularly permuted ATP-grasp superfamily protein
MRRRLQPAIDHYNDLIASDLSSAERTYDDLVRKQREERVFFGGRTLAQSVRPAFVTEDFYTDVQDTVYLIRQAILKIAAAFFNDETVLRKEMGLYDWEIELAAVPTNVIRLSATARMDAFVTEQSFKFVELNAESPAGIAYIHKLAQIYRSLDLFREFEKRYPVRFVSPLEHTVAGLLQVYHEEFDGREATPSFAIVDRMDVPTRSEFDLIAEYLQRLGFPCEICDPRELDCRDGWIYANGRKIDILYRRLLLNEYYEMRDDCAAFLEGYCAQKTCYLNSFRTKLVHKKALFAFLTDPRFTHVLSDRERSAISEHIPWTRRLHEQVTSFRGLAIDLVDFIRVNRSYFVIKPNDEYGGKDVTIGFACSSSDWDAAIDQGLERGHVVQETVDISREPFLLRGDGSWEMVPSVVDLDPYLNGPLMGGCLVRTSASNLANVTAGGGSLPMFILRYT